MINGSKDAFNTIFQVYYNDLVMFAYTFTRDNNEAEEIVQEVFVKLWIRHEDLKLESSLKSYLLKSVQNRCLDNIRHKKIKEKFAEMQSDISLLVNDTHNYILYSDLQKHIDQELDKMPVEIAQTFRLSRFAGLKNHEIAQKMNVSQRTVESWISKALQILQKQLKRLYY